MLNSFFFSFYYLAPSILGFFGLASLVAKEGVD